MSVQRLAWCTRPRILRVRAWIKVWRERVLLYRPSTSSSFLCNGSLKLFATSLCNYTHTHTHRETQKLDFFFSYADQDFKVVICSSDGRTEFSSAVNPVKCHMILQNPNFYLSQKNSDPIHTIPQYKKENMGGGGHEAKYLFKILLAHSWHA